MGDNKEVSTSSWLEERLKTIRRQLLFGLIVFSIMTLLLNEVTNYYQKKSAAELVIKSLRKSLLSQDQRAMVALLNASAFPNFVDVRVVDHINSSEFLVQDESSHSNFNAHFKILIPFNKGDEDSTAAELIFSYQLFSGWWLSVALSFCYGLLAIIFYRQAAGKLRLQWDSNLIQEKAKASELLSRQVAHDIRSPLSALNMLSASLKEVPEEKRLILRNSIQRINDIANDLFAKGKPSSLSPVTKLSEISTLKKNSDKFEMILLPAFIDGIVSEKRIQFRDQIGVTIESDFKHSFGSFVSADGKELARVISNSINNSVEAFPEKKGSITVAVRGYKDKVQLSIRDNGKGMPPEILAKLGEAGVTYGKEDPLSGSGLGVYHAIKAIEAMGGKLHISSQLGIGTLIDIQLPRIENPSWFLDSINLKSGQQVISLDDDLTIHQIWSERLESIQATERNISLKNFTSANEFKEFIKAGLTVDPKPLYLIDYEFLGQNTTGIELIKQLKLQENVVLVTSHYEEPEIKSYCETLKIKLLPKSLAGFVPIEIST